MTAYAKPKGTGYKKVTHGNSPQPPHGDLRRLGRGPLSGASPWYRYDRPRVVGGRPCLRQVRQVGVGGVVYLKVKQGEAVP